MFNIDLILKSIFRQSIVNKYWHGKLSSINCSGIHIAIMNEPYLSLVLDEKKKIESRFGLKRQKPYENVKKGDIIILKESGGKVIAIFEAGEVLFFDLTKEIKLDDIKIRYSKELCLLEEFWEAKVNARFCTLIYINNLFILPFPLTLSQKNRQAWATFKCTDTNLLEMETGTKIICLSGEVASGKSTVATELASLLCSRQYSVSDYLKFLAEQEGTQNPDRAALQKMGERCINNGWNNFCAEFMSFVHLDGQFLVVAGIRHAEFLSALKKYNSRYDVFNFHLIVEQEDVNERLKSRGELEVDKAHIAEGDMCELRNFSDAIFNTSISSPREICGEIVKIIVMNCLGE